MYNSITVKTNTCMWCRMLNSRASNTAGAYGDISLRLNTERC